MLVCPEIADQLIESSNLGQDSKVVEIGAGKGILTRKLGEKGVRLTSFEIDGNLFQITNRLVSGFKNVKLLHADAFSYELKKERFDACITSLPYSESLRFIRWLSLRTNQFNLVAAIVQSEFANKLVAIPGDAAYRAVTVLTQISFKTDLLFKINRDCFTPPPKVESAAIRMVPFTDLSIPYFTEARIRILDFIFSFRGRRLSSALRKLLGKERLSSFPDDLLSMRVELVPPKNYAQIIRLCGEFST